MSVNISNSNSSVNDSSEEFGQGLLLFGDETQTIQFNDLEIQELAQDLVSRPPSPTEQKERSFQYQSQTIDNFEIIMPEKTVMSQGVNDQSCGVTCASMIVVDQAKALATTLESTITNYSHVGSSSPDCRSIEQLLSQHGVAYRAGSASSIEGLSLPALVRGNFNFGGKPGTHWVIVDKVYGRTCEIRDPFKGKAAKGSVEELNAAVQGAHTRKSNDFNIYEVGGSQKKKSKCCIIL